jgi:hypothetical protein
MNQNNALALNEGITLKYWVKPQENPLESIKRAMLSPYSSTRQAMVNAWGNPECVPGQYGHALAQLKRDVATQTALTVGLPLQSWQVIWQRSTPDMLAVAIVPFGRVRTQAEKNAETAYEKRMAADEANRLRDMEIDPVFPVPICGLTPAYITAIQNIALHVLEWDSGMSFIDQQNWSKLLASLNREACKALGRLNLSHEGKVAAMRVLNYIQVIPQEVL